ncbi:Fic family protein [Flexivirga caeni]|uniref:Fic family protein n=1 Tax=Flexivirga caeni TaxID=2294115 RepID=A0A3M9LYC4_9MICO|nr:Fic family protein [Flexivirga caeni]
MLKAAIAANIALARLDQAAALLPNPTVLINAIPLLEAQASSEIENIVTTTDDLFRHMDDDDAADPATKETLRYRTALRRGFEATAARGVTRRMAEAVCTAIKSREMQLRVLPGTRIVNPATGNIVYSPPEGREVIAEKLTEWERFIHAEDGMDPLVRLAAAHYQFEAIHPFTDGNGRTGRILNVLMLVEAGLLRQPILYLSRYIIANKSDYYRGLLGVTARQDWESWIIFLLNGIRQASDDGVAVIAAIRDLRDDFAQRARLATRGGADSELLAVMFEQPYTRIRTVVDRCGVSRPTATKWLEALVDAGLLADTKIGRDRLFVNRELTDLLVRFSASAQEQG